MAQIVYRDLKAVHESFKQGGVVTKTHIYTLLRAKMGIDLASDPRFTTVHAHFLSASENLSVEDFERCCAPCSHLLMKIFNGDLVVNDWEGLVSQINAIYKEQLKNKEGVSADYIPQLASVNPEQLAISVCTVDGQRFHIGDSDEMFTIQSVSKTMNYMLAVDEHDLATVHECVGFEPSGRKFNDFVFLEGGVPHNPYINAGAIMTVSFLRPEADMADRFVYVHNQYKEMAGGEPVGYDNATYLSEKATGNRNFALSYYMSSEGAFPEWISSKERVLQNLDLYFQLCSVEVCTRSLSVMAGTIANGGICPITLKRIVRQDSVEACIALMYTCGMYNYSGEFAFLVGLPAKSGVSGDLLLVIPGVMGIAIWSPRLDSIGNSVRAVEICKELTRRLRIHGHDRLPKAIYSEGSNHITSVGKRVQSFSTDTMTLALLQAVADDDLQTIRQLLLRGVDVNSCDYEGTSALMVACKRNRYSVAKFLLRQGAKASMLDKYKRTAADLMDPKNTELLSLLNKGVM